MNHILFTLAGFISNVLATIDIIFVQNKLWTGTMITTFLIALINYGLVAKLIDNPKKWLDILLYALGGGVGAGLIVWSNVI